MTKAKGRQRRERSLVVMGPDHSPDEVPCFEVGLDNQTVHPTYSFVDGLEVQVVVRERRDERTGRLVEFAVMLQARVVGGEWVDVERVDCAGGQRIHIDVYMRDGTKRKDYGRVPPECRDDVDAALRWALEYIWCVEERISAWVGCAPD